MRKQYSKSSLCKPLYLQPWDKKSIHYIVLISYNHKYLQHCRLLQVELGNPSFLLWVIDRDLGCNLPWIWRYRKVEISSVKRGNFDKITQFFGFRTISPFKRYNFLLKTLFVRHRVCNKSPFDSLTIRSSVRMLQTDFRLCC